MQPVTSIREIYIVDEMRRQFFIHKLYIDRMLKMDKIFQKSLEKMRYRSKRNYLSKFKNILEVFTNEFSDLADQQFKKSAKYLTSLLKDEEERNDFLKYLKIEVRNLHQEYDTRLEMMYNFNNLGNKEFWDVGLSFLKKMSGFKSDDDYIGFDPNKIRFSERAENSPIKDFHFAKNGNLNFTERNKFKEGYQNMNQPVAPTDSDKEKNVMKVEVKGRSRAKSMRDNTKNKDKKRKPLLNF